VEAIEEALLEEGDDEEQAALCAAFSLPTT
jgi:hypothetical protein